MKDKNDGHILGSLRFNYMIPVPDHLLYKLDSFRHSLVTNLIHSNVDVTTISNIVGHINGNVTLSVYAHEFKEATAYGCNVMSDLLNQQKKQTKTMSE